MNNEFDVEMSNNEIEIDFELYPKGPKGKDATINGYNSIELVAGENIRITQVGNKIIISATGDIPPAPTGDIQFTTSDNKIFITSNNANFIVKERD